MSDPQNWHLHITIPVYWAYHNSHLIPYKYVTRLLFGLQFQYSYPTNNLCLSLVAGYVSIYLEDPGVQDFSRKTQLRSPAVHYRNSPLRGAVLWEVQSIERCSPLRGAVQWEVQSVEGSVWREHFTGSVQWEGQSIERSSSFVRGSPCEGQSSERGSPLRGSVWWEAGDFKEENFAKHFGDKRNQKVNSTRRYRSVFYFSKTTPSTVKTQ